MNFCHGLGLGLHERPLISRVTSFRDPIELKAGMVFAVETYCPATDGISAARIEEEVVLTPTGAKIITLYPAEDLPIANPYWARELSRRVVELGLGRELAEALQ